MTTPKLLRPTHLSFFVTHSETGVPISRLPLYVEVAVTKITPHRPPIRSSGNFSEALFFTLNQVEDGLASNESVRGRIVDAVLQVFGEVLDLSSQNEVIDNVERASTLIQRTIKGVLDASEGSRLSEIPVPKLKLLMADVLKNVAKELGFGLHPDILESGSPSTDPLGVVTTDHVGYASFDITRLRPEVYQMLVGAIEVRRNNSSGAPGLSIWVYPYGMTERFDALAQARFTADAIVGRLSIKASSLPAQLKNMGPTALQNPSLTDWRLSPASFAASPKALIGENGCEELVPSGHVLQEFVIRQVVRIADLPSIVEAQSPSKLAKPVKPAYVDEYKVSWHSLGHSLGEILYSLPLAPAESVKLAVVDWSWDSVAKRDENTGSSESILHQTHRDRTIVETVKAGLKEMQHGSSFMGGAAGSSGATGGANLGVVGVGAAVGNAWSLGGSTATSNGSRDLAAENVQRLSDSFSQASAAQRELHSTVVIQARQEEQESIQTRTFTNYNHSHTLTILYYEILRHYRITVEWVRRRNAVLVSIPPRIAQFDASTLINHRFLLEPALLDSTLKPAFDILEKQETIREYQSEHGIVPNGLPIQPFWEGDIEFGLFEIGIKCGPDDDWYTPDVVMINLVLFDGVTVSRPLMQTWNKATETDNINVGDRLNDKDTNIGWFVAKLAGGSKVKWGNLVGFEFVLHGNNAWKMDRLAINAFHAGGRKVLLGDSVVGDIDVDLYFDVNSSSNTVTHINRPGPKPAPLPPIQTPEKSQTPEELHQVKKLMQHFELHKDYYNRIVLLNSDPASIAIQFENHPWLENNVDPTPLEVFGSYVAYPLAKRAQIDDALILDLSAALNSLDATQRQEAESRLANMSDSDRQYVQERLALAEAKSERLITLPTRGVFAEGKLGHCNLSEEIDNTRFWKWEEHPIPFEAPGINPVTPISPQPQQTSIAPTPFPQSLVNIVNPSPAPDPTGLSAALALLGTPNIFRDMSGRQEVADLLKKLSDNTIAIAEAANRAREIQAKYGTDLDNNQKELALGQTQADTEVAKAMLQQRREEAQQVKPSEAQDAIKLSESEMKKGNVTPEQHKAYTSQQLSNVPGAGPKQPRLIKLDVEMKYPDGATLSGNFLFAIDDIDGDGQVVKESHSVFTGSRMFAVKMRGHRLRIYIHGYDSILPPEQTGNSAIRFFDSSGTITIPSSGDHFIVRAVPSGIIETKVTAKSKADAETKATIGGKISAKEIIEISQGQEVTQGEGTETTHQYTIKHYTRGLAFSLVP